MQLVDQHDRKQRNVNLSIIIPFYNEEETAPFLIDELSRVFNPKALKEARISQVFYIFVDDGSRDSGTTIFVDALQKGILQGSMLRLSRNFGHQAAVAAGLDYCQGDVVVIIDADLQDSPQEIFFMLNQWREGADVVYGIRRKRKESIFKRMAYYLFYRILNFLSEGLIPRDSGDFSLFDFKVVEAIKQLPERMRFFRGMRAWVGFNQKEHEYERDVRANGNSKYTFKKLYSLATDGIASSSIRPLRITQVLSIISFIFAAICVSIATFRLATHPQANETLIVAYATLIAMGIIGFCILLSLYIISAYLGRMFIEVKARPSYIVSQIIST